jgi:fructokinase
MEHLSQSPIGIGIDLGGSKIEVVALDTLGNQLYRKRITTPASNYKAIVRAIVALVKEVESELQVTAPVGVCTPGAISPATGLIKNSNTVCLNGQPFTTDLSDALSRSIRCANDANCFTLSEATDGAASSDAVVFGVILGTGVGGGIAVHKRLIVGPNAITGEWGHNPLPWASDDEVLSRPCYCGKRGCVETFLSGPGLSRDYQSVTGKNATALEVAERAENGDEIAGSVLGVFEQRLAKSLASVINVLDPDAIVLGGGLSNIDRLYVSIPPLLTRYVFSDRVDTKLIRAVHGDSSGVRGAARLWYA